MLYRPINLTVLLLHIYAKTEASAEATIHVIAKYAVETNGPAHLPHSQIS